MFALMKYKHWKLHIKRVLFFYFHVLSFLCPHRVVESFSPFIDRLRHQRPPGPWQAHQAYRIVNDQPELLLCSSRAKSGCVLTRACNHVRASPADLSRFRNTWYPFSYATISWAQTTDSLFILLTCLCVYIDGAIYARQYIYQRPVYTSIYPILLHGLLYTWSALLAPVW